MTIRPKKSLLPVGLAAVVLALTAGCGGSSSAGSTTAGPVQLATTTQPGAADQPTPGAAATSPGLQSAGAPRQPVISPARTALGIVLVNAKNMTIYDFGKDAKDTSACTGDCVKSWPIVKAPAKLPVSIPGISGELGVLVRADGKRQLTVDHRPVYTFTGDDAPGDAKGQGRNNGLWTVVSPAGKPLSRPAAG
jgi:predicted lipoprotein with Yx(FWY)xxD motif